MKPVNFFIEKTESFITKLTSMKLVEFDLVTLTNDIYQDRELGNNSTYNKQSEELKELKFQIKLMFSEFDNGSLFSEKIENFQSSNIFSNEPLKSNLLKTTQLFIDFLNDYRV